MGTSPRSAVGPCRRCAAAPGVTAQLHARQLAELARSGARSAHHAVRLDHTPARGHAARLDPGHLGVRLDSRSVRTGACRVALHGGVRGCMSRERAERAREHAVQPGQRRQLVRLVGREHPARKAEPVLHLHAALELGHLRGAREQEQVADAPQVDLRAGTLAEGAPRLERADADPHVQLVREHRADAARALRRGAGAELRPLDEQHVLHSRLGEVEGDARADHATAHDHY